MKPKHVKTGMRVEVFGIVGQTRARHGRVVALSRVMGPNAKLSSVSVRFDGDALDSRITSRGIERMRPERPVPVNDPEKLERWLES